mgnify:CR=1 FL=1
MLTTDDYMAQPPGRPDLRAPYGAHPDQFGELYLPAGAGPHPPVVLIHGGCWRDQYGLAPLGQLCEALRSAGYAVWSLEYRRLGGGGGWPATFADIAAGADALRRLDAPLYLGRAVGATRPAATWPSGWRPGPASPARARCGAPTRCRSGACWLWRASPTSRRPRGARSAAPPCPSCSAVRPT